MTDRDEEAENFGRKRSCPFVIIEDIVKTEEKVFLQKK